MFIFIIVFSSIVILLTIAGFSFGIALMISPKLRGKFLSSQIKANRYAIEESKEDIESISTNMSNATKEGVEITARAIKEGLLEESIFCKHCGAKIDADSKFCKHCGKEL